MKYSKRYEEDYDWYLSVKDIFNFDGSKDYYNKKGQDIIQHNNNGVTAKESFYLWDSQGKITPTKEPDELKTLLKTKGSVNLHIKMYAKSRVRGVLPKIEFNEMLKEFNAPEWFSDAVEKQKYKYYDN